MNPISPLQRLAAALGALAVTSFMLAGIELLSVHPAGTAVLYEASGAPLQARCTPAS